ncbi:hypothetical protein CFP56_034802 [Quercus suber]|uniref:Uncharacterized protein n=1 Tax=Quercus suber TaxID=58331 RepID=A0AAW0LS62_QUESU
MEVWKVHFGWLVKAAGMAASFFDVLQLCSEKSNLVDLFVMIVSQIWTRRNKLRVGKGAAPLDMINQLASASLQVFLQSSLNPTKVPSPLKVTKWLPPPSNWVKINFDGATFSDSSSAGLGAIIRNDLVATTSIEEDLLTSILCRTYGSIELTFQHVVKNDQLEKGVTPSYNQKDKLAHIQFIGLPFYKLMLYLKREFLGAADMIRLLHAAKGCERGVEMGGSGLERKVLDMFEVGPYESSYQMGSPIGQTPKPQLLLKTFTDNNQKKFPSYWDELILGTVEGSEVPFLPRLFPPLLPKTTIISDVDSPDECSDVLIVSDSMAVAAHYDEDANVALVGHTYLIKGMLSNELSFIAYTYAGEPPSCSFGFNSHGLNTQILNIETASRNRISVREVGVTPYNKELADVLPKTSFIGDTADAKYPIYSISNLKGIRKPSFGLLHHAAPCKKTLYAIFSGPIVHTLCTAVINLDEQILSIIEGDPKEGEVSHVFTMSSKEFKMPR